MSKGNMLLGHARGKVGDLVFSRSNGEQVTKSRNSNPHNPRTQAQLLQRIVMNTVMRAYSTMQNICDHSFEGLTVGTPTQSAFIRANVRLLRNRIANLVAAGYDIYDEYSYVPLGADTFAPNAFLISKGTLQEVVPTFGISDTMLRAAVAVAGNTYQDVINSLGLKRGDQITLIQISRRNDNVVFNYARIILDPTIDGAAAPLSTEFISNNAVNAPSVRNQGEIGYIKFMGNKIYFDLLGTATLGGNIMCAAVIVSRKVNGKYLRSTSFLQLNDAVIAGYGYSLGEAIDLAAEGISTLSDEYLNNAGNGAVLSTAAQAASPVITSLSVNNIDIPASGITEIDMTGVTTNININGVTANADGYYIGFTDGNGVWFDGAGTEIVNNAFNASVGGDYENALQAFISTTNVRVDMLQNVVYRYPGLFKFINF